MSDDIVFSPFKLNGFTLKNRIGVDDIRQNKELPLHKSEEANVAYTEEPLA